MKILLITAEALVCLWMFPLWLLRGLCGGCLIPLRYGRQVLIDYRKWDEELRKRGKLRLLESMRFDPDRPSCGAARAERANLSWQLQEQLRGQLRRSLRTATDEKAEALTELNQAPFDYGSTSLQRSPRTHERLVVTGSCQSCQP